MKKVFWYTTSFWGWNTCQ